MNFVGKQKYSFDVWEQVFVLESENVGKKRSKSRVIDPITNKQVGESYYYSYEYKAIFRNINNGTRLILRTTVPNQGEEFEVDRLMDWLDFYIKEHSGLFHAFVEPNNIVEVLYAGDEPSLTIVWGDSYEPMSIDDYVRKHGKVYE